MENLSHSRQPNKSSTSVSKKSCNGTNFMTKTSYDDVFGGPPKFGAPTLAPRVEDYTEIFGGFHAPRTSSIPVLDLPVVDDDDVFFDVQSSGFDYNEVFGGFDGLDCAVSFEELVMDQSNGVNGDLDSCEEDAWTPTESDSLSEESDKSGKNQSLSNRDSYESVDGSMEFKISFHKANLPNQRSDEDIPNGITHVTQIHAVPGYTFLVDKTTPLEKAYYENPPLEVTDDSNLHMDFGGGLTRERNLKKILSQPSAGSSVEQAFVNGLKPQRAYGRNSSLPNKPFVTVSEISLRTQPSEVPPPCRPAPPLHINNGDPGKIAKNCKTTVSEGIIGDTSPPFYDVEVDASSSAAVSAAAMKEVMEKAQAKLKTAKELLERKREGVQSHKHDKKKEGKMFSTVEGSSSIKEESMHGTRERQVNGMAFSIGEDRQRDSKTAKTVPDSLEGENVSNMDKTLAEKHGGSGKIVEAGEWKEATEFFELVKTDRSTFEQANYDEVLELDAKIQDCRQKIKKGAMEALDHQQVNGCTIETNSEGSELGENEKNLKVAKEACGRSESNRRSGASRATRKHRGHEKRVKVAEEVCNQVEEEEKCRVVQLSVEIEKKPSGDDVPEKHENTVKVQKKESRFEGKRTMKHQENEQPLRETIRSMGNETTFKESCDMLASGRRRRDAVEQIENEKKLKEALEREDKERKLMGVFEQEENEKKLKEAHEREETERLKKEVLEKIESEKKQIEAFELEESEKRLKRGFEQEENEKQEAREREENEKRHKEALEKDEQERKQKETSKRGESERRLKESRDIEKVEKALKEAHEKEETGKGLGVGCEQVDKCETSKEAQGRVEESEMRSKKEAFEKEESWDMSMEARVETEKRFTDVGEAEDLKVLNRAHEQNRWDDYGTKLKMAEAPVRFKEREDLMVSKKASMLEENLRVTPSVGQHEENCKNGVVSQGFFSYDGNVEIQIEYSDGEMVAEAVETTNVVADRKSEVFGMAQDNLKHEEYTLKMKGAAGPICEDHSVKTTGESGMGVGQEKTTSCLQPDSGTKSQEKKVANERGERENNIKQTQVEVSLNPKLDKDKFVPTQLVKESAQIGRKMEAAQQSVLEGKRNIQKTSQSANASQNLERKEKNINETVTSEDKEAERMRRRERELEIERLRRIEEEREREREREKDRMAVDLATLEARERAYGEARERAERAAVERATSEVRKRALAEARERLEKACAEAKEKSLAEKSSMEARIRAERAAVERATAEARDRATEKAMAERAAFEARERLDRTFSEKFSAASRNSTIRPTSSSSDIQEQKFQSASSFNSSIYPYSSASYNAERSDEFEGESVQRCKARLERHQRTAERAAKALEEKNMRDLLAQREQAERNRLAETLDADVKRWSSGKEGNLRALLSTLQYILGLDSGWHPIPLTEVITSAAVKKAYRKATLCVHPDKLQQRGASIQQKYICEKVFDLLKEAWNKFNSEER